MANDDFEIEIETALNTTLEGTTGSFKIGDESSESSSLEVKYFLTHVGLDFKNSQNNKILSELAPVREIFDTKLLDFDQIMQRDINDARVSSKLIPYILDEKNSISVKFFPPIVIMALPIDPNGAKLKNKYPEVTSYESNEKKHGVSNWWITRAGSVGEEVFQFEQPLINGMPSKKKLVRFRMDNKRCKLVIVDGQHRAMALLALYRNKNSEWSDSKRKPYEPYYEEWTADYIDQFKLDQVELPVIICTVPSLDANFKGDFGLEKAARSIFLTLNKTARPVSSARNLLLDDNDIISYFMRSVLADVKNSDRRSNHYLRINNIDLDEEKQKLNNPIAITSVKSIYYIIEHLLLSTVDSVKGISDRKGKFGNRIDFEVGLEKLNGYDDLLSEECDKTTRSHFSDNVISILNGNFMAIYGDYITRFYREFSPFKIYSEATIQLQQNIKRSDDTHINSMIFNGQGEINVFEEYLSDLNDRRNNQSLKDLPRIEKVLDDLNDTNKRLKHRIEELYKIRSQLFIRDNKERSKIIGNELAFNLTYRSINYLYNNIFSSQAFQAGLVCTFFGEIDHARSLEEEIKDVHNTYEEYISQINAFFHPRTFSAFKRLVNLFYGEVQVNEDNIIKNILSNTQDGFNDVVSLSEMKPNSWPTYRYLILEVWNPSNDSLKSLVDKQVEICRSDVSKKLYNKYKTQYAQLERIDVKDIDSNAESLIIRNAYDSFHAFLKNIGRSTSFTDAKFINYLD